MVVDRVDRRLVMLFSDFAAGITTIRLLFLYLSGDLVIWHLYAAGLLTGITKAFPGPAYSAATTMMVAPKDFNRVDRAYWRAAGRVGVAGACALAGGRADGVDWVGGGHVGGCSDLCSGDGHAAYCAGLPQPVADDGEESAGSLAHR